MDVLLVGAELEENLALRYLGASLRKAGHTPRYARFDNPGDTAEVVAQAARLRPGLVGLSATFQFRAKEFGALAGALRDGKVTAPIVVGGHFPTFAFREMLEEFPAIDVVARHEGEATIVELADAATRGPLDPEALLPIDGLAFRGDDGAVEGGLRRCARARPDRGVRKVDGAPAARSAPAADAGAAASARSAPRALRRGPARAHGDDDDHGDRDRDADLEAAATARSAPQAVRRGGREEAQEASSPARSAPAPAHAVGARSSVRARWRRGRCAGAGNGCARPSVARGDDGWSP